MSARSFEIIGAPYDGASTLGYPGSRYAPARIRQQLEWITQRVENGQVFSLTTGSLLPAPQLHDGGDAHIVAHDLKATLANTSERLVNSIHNGHVPILLGGDDCFLYAGTQGLHDATDGIVAVIHFDAHLDVMDQNEQQGTHSQSSGMRRSLELERASADHSIQIGLRHFNFPSSFEYLNNSGLARITAQEASHMGPQAVAQKFSTVFMAQTLFISHSILTRLTQHTHRVQVPSNPEVLHRRMLSKSSRLSRLTATHLLSPR